MDDLTLAQRLAHKFEGDDDALEAARRLRSLAEAEKGLLSATQLEHLEKGVQSGVPWTPFYKEQITRVFAQATALIAARAENAELRKDASYYEWRLKEVVPLFEEARDALPAIMLSSAKLHSVRLDLGDRMDKAGTRTRVDFAALSRESGKAKP